MIEAVNSVLSNAPLVRGAAEQVNASRVVQPAADVSPKVDSAPPVILAPYVSPYIEVNTSYNKAVLQIRDSDTGDVIRQFPSESLLAQRAAEASLRAAQEAVRAQLTEQHTSSPSPASQGGSEGVKSSGFTAPASSEAPQLTAQNASSSSEQAQIASAAFASAALTSAPSQSAGVSVVA